MKLPGSWWTVGHADDMLALRVVRQNGDWRDYWAKSANTAAPANQNRPPPPKKAAA